VILLDSIKNEIRLTNLIPFLIEQRTESLIIIRVTSPQKPGFDCRPFRVRFVVDSVALGHVVPRAPPFSPVVIITPIIRTHPHIHVAVTRKMKERKLGNRPKTLIFRKWGHSIDKYYHFVL
jgi:hypothetical protein